MTALVMRVRRAKAPAPDPRRGPGHDLQPEEEAGPQTGEGRAGDQPEREE